MGRGQAHTAASGVGAGFLSAAKGNIEPDGCSFIFQTTVTATTQMTCFEVHVNSHYVIIVTKCVLATICLCYGAKHYIKKTR